MEDDAAASSLSRGNQELLKATKIKLAERAKFFGQHLEECDLSSMALHITEMGAMDVAEVFSPPRLTRRAREFGLRAGFVVDLSTERRRGERWDLSLQSHVKALERLIRKEKPALLVVSPPCTDLCGLLRLTHTAQ